MLADNTAGSDDFLREVDAALRHKRGAAGAVLAVNLGLAAVLSLGAYVVTASSRSETVWNRHFFSEWAAWSHGWATRTEVNATVIGLLTAALTLYVSTTLQSISRDIDASGAASRILLDDITLMTCIAGAVLGWILAMGAGWHVRTALAWGPAVATAVLLSVLAASTEARALTRRQGRWALERARRDLLGKIGDAPRLHWLRAMPWIRLLGSSTAAAVPAAVGLALAFPDSLIVVLILAVGVALVWSVLIGILWGSVAEIRALQVRHDLRRIPVDAVPTVLWALGVVAFLGLATWSAADAWGVVSFTLAVLFGLAPLSSSWTEGLHHRHLHRHLAAVDKELAAITKKLASTTREPAPEPGRAPWPPEDRDLAWSVELGGLRILRFRNKPRPG